MDRYRLGAGHGAGRPRPSPGRPASSPHMHPLQQRDALPAGDVVAQLVDRMPPRVEFLRTGSAWPAPPAPANTVTSAAISSAEGLPLTTWKCGSRWGGSSIVMSRGSETSTISASWSQLNSLSNRRIGQSGMLPCFFGGV